MVYIPYYYIKDMPTISVFYYPLRMNDKKERVFKQKDTTETVDTKTMRETLYLKDVEHWRIYKAGGFEII